MIWMSINVSPLLLILKHFLWTVIFVKCVTHSLTLIAFVHVQDHSCYVSCVAARIDVFIQQSDIVATQSMYLSVSIFTLKITTRHMTMTHTHTHTVLMRFTLIEGFNSISNFLSIFRLLFDLSRLNHHKPVYILQFTQTSKLN